MSTLKAEVVKVEVGPHPNADRLDLCKISGKLWQCVSQKGQFKTGDLAVYIPIDSVLPPELVTKLGIEKMYSKRIRTVKLRNYISQGLLMHPSLLPTPVAEGQDLTADLGITKYEEPIPIHMAGKVIAEAPGMLRYTDIENIKNYPDVFGPDEIVIATEKIHGTNFRAYKFEGQLYVGSHRLNIVRDEQNLYWRGALKLGLDEKLQEGEEVFGEVFGFGVQDLCYDRKQNQIDVAVFDIVKGGKFLDYGELEATCEARGWTPAPFAYAGPFSKFKMPDKSLIAPDQIIEGVVLRPEKEEFSERLQGRKILKFISDEYLLREGGTERH